MDFIFKKIIATHRGISSPGFIFGWFLGFVSVFSLLLYNGFNIDWKENGIKTLKKGV